MSNMETTDESRGRETGGRLAPYDYQWRAFSRWCLEHHGGLPIPVPAEVVAEYLSYQAEGGARPSTLKVIAAAIVRQHTAMDLPNPCESAIVESVLSDSERGALPVAPRSRPLDLEGYRAIRKSAKVPRPGRGGREENGLRARERGLMDIAMIGLMRDGMLRVREASDLTWGAIESLPDGTGRLRTGEGQDAESRVLSADTMRLLDAIRNDAGDADRIIGLMPNQITLRIGAAAEHAGLGSGYSGESPRLGMLKDLDELGVLLLGKQLESEVLETS